MAAPTLLTRGLGNVDETLTMAVENILPGIKDNVFNENTLLGWMYGAGKKMLKGGASIVHGVRYGKNTTAQSYSRYGLLNTTPQDNLTQGQWPWKQYAVTMAIDGFTQRIAGKGKYALVDPLEEKRSEAEDSLRELLEIDMFKASPGSDDLRSLPNVILASGTEGQINGTVSSWWQSLVSTAGSWGTGVGPSALRTLLNTLAKRQPVGPVEALCSDQTSYESYEGTLQSHYRYTEGTPDNETRKLLFKETPWYWSVQGTSGVIYALHSKAVHFVVNSDTDFYVDPFIRATDQDASVGKILFAGALITTCRRKLGKSTSNAA